MAQRTGSADLPLHRGRVPGWLADRMMRLGAVMSQAIVHHYGRDELLRRRAHPFWFQLGAFLVPRSPVQGREANAVISCSTRPASARRCRRTGDGDAIDRCPPRRATAFELTVKGFAEACARSADSFRILDLAVEFAPDLIGEVAQQVIGVSRASPS